ncbi:Crp/Fnr family transcriptional regulator [Methylobacterium sp. J-026]|uniref:Crp/Fnr family transcriptional regulator n=1 Tax=Methylobacterium sp. J-026 TaxID=2836624 RepID=UPI001FBA79E9|nr:Crp/Fnr family transcriptional regulator [Methylobacterium sp. J-026]MCJ2134144.1 Crp/Fnr family transcriptional regulator [Methylobacterium sp. J-026]
MGLPLQLNGTMSQPTQDSCLNRLLRSLNPDDFCLLRPHLELVVLSLSDVLITADTPITQVAFVERGIVSLVSVAADGQQVEVGLVGCEGMVGVPILLDAERTPDEARVQAIGLAQVIPVSAFSEALRSSPRLHNHLLRYAHVLSVLATSTALANGRYTLEPRLARWLLMVHDRTESDELPTTHRFLSLMLGVNRPGLTGAISVLERSGVIGRQRGTLIVRDRAALLALAGPSYGAPEAEYERLFTGPAPGVS